MKSQAVSKPVLRPIESGQRPEPQLFAYDAKPISKPIVCGVVRAVDGLCLLTACIGASFWARASAGADWQLSGLAMLLGAIVALNLMHLFGAYRFDVLDRLGPSFRRLAGAWVLSTGVVAVADLLTRVSGHAEDVGLWAWFAGGLVLLSVSRLSIYGRIRHWLAQGRLSRRVVVFGAGPLGQTLLRRFNMKLDPTIKIVGVYDDRMTRLPRRCMGFPIRGTLDDLMRDARKQRIDMAIVALPLSADWRLTEVLNKLSLLPIDVRLCPDQFGFQLGTCQVSHLAGMSFLNALEKPLRDWRRIAKEVEDRVLAALILILIAPVMLAVALLIKLDSPGPVLFRQKRYGLNNELIEVFKFRTMYHHKQDQNAEQLTRRNDPRVTKIGAFLRQTSIDELPQFINVLQGEMSIVGPRPHALAAKAGGLLYQDAVKYYDARHRMKPGITGWAQVNGWRGETETVEQIQKRVEHDLYYIENWSILLDLKIILRTIFGGFTGRYAY